MAAVSPALSKPAFDPIFLPGSGSDHTISLREHSLVTSRFPSRLPSRLPSPAPSSCASDADGCSYPTDLLPPSPSCSPVQILRKEKPTLLTLPTEILIIILRQLFVLRKGHTYPYPQVPQISREEAAALCATCKLLRGLVLQFGSYPRDLFMDDISGVSDWPQVDSGLVVGVRPRFQFVLEPIWTLSQRLSLRWLDSGPLVWKEGAKNSIWAVLKAKSDEKYGLQAERLKPDTPAGGRALRADLVNTTGYKPPNPRLYLESCRAYLWQDQPCPAPVPTQSRYWPRYSTPLLADFTAIISTAETLYKLDINFPGAIELFTKCVLSSSSPYLQTLKELDLRNGTEICFPPPTGLFQAISRLRLLELLSLTGNCGGREARFPVHERLMRGIHVHPQEGEKVKRRIADLWGWECPAITKAPRPPGLRVCNVFDMAGVTISGEGKSSGIFRGTCWPWPDVRPDVRGNEDKDEYMYDDNVILFSMRPGTNMSDAMLRLKIQYHITTRGNPLLTWYECGTGV